ncbi:anti-sigma factor [Paraburkholderia sp. NMBU_R16]|uniref:anti-sigma factor family protein n=1 Tax=Paraburkholderia sp. NMBU_R16 TaxID=2698676 RepID=UPI0015679DAC|nr:anti-sigma factor [Paraburkholderia sp. NMBU_R16]NRO99124.1 anti-sigma factor [Paraburkholderia sp. NMBU_R16]
MNAFSPTEEDLQAYVDGQLDDERRRALERYLAGHPEAARHVEQLKREAQTLRVAMEGLPASPTPGHLDPAYIRRANHARARRHLAMAASFVLCASVGVLGGWQLRDMSVRANYLPMADAAQAYRMFAVSMPTGLADIETTDAARLQSWLDARFGESEPIPDFRSFGFEPSGARLMATEQGAAAMVLYRNARGAAIVYYLRPPGNLLHFDKGNRKDGELLTQYWRRGKYIYAVVSPAGQSWAMPVQQAMDPLRG